jgi:DNA-directed RNA polymerase subunit omega
VARVTVEDCLERIVDQFALVHLTALRYRQLHRGGPPLVKSKNKDIVTALREVAADKVRFREPVQEILLASTRAMTQDFQGLTRDQLDNNTPLI